MGPSLGSDPLAAPLGLRVAPLVGTAEQANSGGGCLPTGDGLSAILTVILSQKKEPFNKPTWKCMAWCLGRP